MKVTYKDDNSVVYEPFATNSRAFRAPRECYIEFYIINDASATYSFNMAPNHTNFSLNDGNIKFDKYVTKVFIDAPKNFTCSFNLEKGEVWATCIDAMSKDNNTIIYTGDWNIRTFKVLEFVKTNRTNYDVSLILKSNDSNIIDYIDKVYIKEIE